MKNLIIFCLAAASVGDVRAAEPLDIAASYAFLVNDVQDGGALYTGTAGALQGLALPLSFRDSADYWGLHVCNFPARDCAVTDRYNPADYSLMPDGGAPGQMQLERVNTRNGTNIYDAATWQIAVTLGHVRNGLGSAVGEQGYDLASNQNTLLSEGHAGNATDPVRGTHRATSNDNGFLYDGETIVDPASAFSFRMLGRSWLSEDPFLGTEYAGLINAVDLPSGNPAYAPGKVNWSDWKPVMGENAWAFLLGPLQAANLHHREQLKSAFVPFEDAAIQNALAVLPAFSALQSPVGGVYYAPGFMDEGQSNANPFIVALENNFSLYAGLRVFDEILGTMLNNQALGQAEKASIISARNTIAVLLHGGVDRGQSTAGLLSFFRNQAWHDGGFVQGGLANDPAQSAAWVPTLSPQAIDVNTWGIAALGAEMVDEWFGFAASFRAWEKVKAWGGYGVGSTLWGVGYSDVDGNGQLANGDYRQGVMSAEWTAGAINMVRSMIAHYREIPVESPHHGTARVLLLELEQDEESMLEALQTLRLDRYSDVAFPGQPDQFDTLIELDTAPYLYASRRHFIPFGWHANPLPSTCATAWVVMLVNHFDPFGVAGVSN